MNATSSELETLFSRAARLYEQGKLSKVAAAKMAGMGRIEFDDHIAELGIVNVHQTPAELSDELAGQPSRRRPVAF